MLAVETSSQAVPGFTLLQEQGPGDQDDRHSSQELLADVVCTVTATSFHTSVSINIKGILCIICTVIKYLELHCCYPQAVCTQHKLLSEHMHSW